MIFNQIAILLELGKDILSRVAATLKTLKILGAMDTPVIRC